MNTNTTNTERIAEEETRFQNSVGAMKSSKLPTGVPFVSPSFADRSQKAMEMEINELLSSCRKEQRTEGEALYAAYDLYTRRRNSMATIECDEEIWEELMKAYAMARKADDIKLALTGEKQGDWADRKREVVGGEGYLKYLVLAVRKILWITGKVNKVDLSRYICKEPWQYDTPKFADYLLEDKEFTPHEKRIKELKGDDLYETALMNEMSDLEIAKFMSIVTDFINICTADSELAKKFDAAIGRKAA